MQEVQEAQFNYNKFSGNTGAPTYDGFLEGTQGVVQLWRDGAYVGDLEGALARSFSLEDVTYEFYWADRLSWTWLSAVQLLQGRSIQELVGVHNTIVNVETVPIWEPSPHVRDIAMVRTNTPVTVTPKEHAMYLYERVRPHIAELLDVHAPSA